MSATKPTVQEAWASVMADVRALAKGDRNAQQGFNFRGVDAVMNAVGPALRAHGVAVVPTGVHDVAADTYTTKGGTVMRDVRLVVSYAITGPAGDTMPGAAAGEASDAGDKATPKAMSVAYRTFLLQALTLPTDERDPDADTYERAAGPSREEAAQRYVPGLVACADPVVLENVRQQAEAEGLLDVAVDTPGGRMILAQAFGTRQQQLAHPQDGAA
jgi:class 3 adenylate cyclase